LIDNCNPNFFKNLKPQIYCNNTEDDRKLPETMREKPTRLHEDQEWNQWVEQGHHDTIGMIALSIKKKHIACGTSTNGANHKIAGNNHPISCVYNCWTMIPLLPLV